MAITAQFVAQPNIEITQINTASAGVRDATGVTVCSGPSTAAAAGVGKRINRTVVQATGTTIAGMVRFFVSNDNGATKRLYVEKTVSGITASASQSPFRTEVPELVGLILPGVSGSNGSYLYTSSEIGNTFNIIVESGIL